jgi:hypothetical protein
VRYYAAFKFIESAVDLGHIHPWTRFLVIKLDLKLLSLVLDGTCNAMLLRFGSLVVGFFRLTLIAQTAIVYRIVVCQKLALLPLSC